MTLALTVASKAPSGTRGVTCRSMMKSCVASSAAAAAVAAATAAGSLRCRKRGVRLAATCTFADPGAAGGGGLGDTFPRIKERDPYKRLGVSREATSEEISEVRVLVIFIFIFIFLQERWHGKQVGYELSLACCLIQARAYLLESYQHDQPSVEAIEAAYDKIISEKLRTRRKSKIKVEGLESSPASPAPGQGKGLAGRLSRILYQPTRNELLQRSLLYIFLATWSVVNAAEGGPAFQLAIALALCIYFQYQRMQKKQLLKPAAITLIGLFLGWIIGSILPIYLPILFPPALAPETICALFAMVFFWFFATFLK